MKVKVKVIDGKLIDCHRRNWSNVSDIGWEYVNKKIRKLEDFHIEQLVKQGDNKFKILFDRIADQIYSLPAGGIGINYKYQLKRHTEDNKLIIKFE